MRRFLDRLDHVGDRLGETNGEYVNLTRGTLTNPRIRMSPILDEAQEIMPGVSITRLEFQDWGVDTIDYEFGSGPVAPQIGDIITRGNAEQFRVLSMSDNEPPYAYMTSNRKRMVVHSERIDDGSL